MLLRLVILPVCFVAQIVVAQASAALSGGAPDKPWRWGGRDITDAEVLRFITDCSLSILLRVSRDGKCWEFSLPEGAQPNLPPVGGARHQPAQLVLHFDIATSEIVEARCGGVALRHDAHVTRNELAIGCLHAIVVQYLHLTIHAAAERSAREITARGVAALEPSSRCVSSLHDDVLNHELSPLSVSNHWLSTLIQTYDYDARPAMVRAVHDFPVPPHSFHPSKLRLRFFKFAVEGHKAVAELVRAHKLGVASEDLFANVLLHGVDHFSAHKAFSAMALTSVDGTGRLTSAWRHFFWVHFWIPHQENPLCKERVRDFRHLPFYAALYDRMRAVDAELADEMIISCSF